VLQLLVQGYTNREIADRLFVSVKTVETHRSRGTQKLGVQGRANLVRYASESGLFTPENLMPDDGKR
jgi:two-component system response regulator NreC